MDTTNQISAYVQRMTFSNTSSYLTTDRLIDMNVRYRRCITAITGKVQDFFWTWATFPTVVGQQEYEIASFVFPDTFSRDIISVDSVSIKYDTDWDYYKLNKGDFNDLGADLSLYTDYAGTPFYFVRDKSIFIAPTVTATSTGKLSGNYRPLDLTLSDSTTEIKIPLLYTYVIAYGMCADYWTSQGKYDVANVYEAKFAEWLQVMVNNLSIRDREIMGYVTE